MYYALVSFKDVPKIGFAHHFYAENYNYTRTKIEKSLEIVYIREGSLTVRLNDETMIAEPGSVFVLLRTLPLTLETGKNSHHSHCTVQLVADFDFEIVKDKEKIPGDYPGLILPFITLPGMETEAIKKQLYSIVSEISVSRELNDFSSSLSAMGVLGILNSKFKKHFLDKSHNSSLLCYKIKRYVSEHMSENIVLSDLSSHLGKTSIYLNSVFKKENGTTICQYINSEKIRLVSELMLNKELSFKNACESVGITDISYGYRLFKKQTGITPAQYKNSQKFLK